MLALATPLLEADTFDEVPDEVPEAGTETLE